MTNQPTASGVSEEMIKHMVNRFLCWKLPKEFHPDAGISFEPEFNKEWNAKRGQPPQRHEPSGTNLFDATQATAMVRYMVEGITTSLTEEMVGRGHKAQQSVKVQAITEFPKSYIAPPHTFTFRDQTFSTFQEAKDAQQKEIVRAILEAALSTKPPQPIPTPDEALREDISDIITALSLIASGHSKGLGRDWQVKKVNAAIAELKRLSRARPEEDKS